MMKIQFFVGDGNYYSGAVNYLTGEGDGYSVYAEVEIPDGASDDYGYLSMKKAIIDTATDCGIDTSAWVWQYDGQEQHLAQDASAHCKVYVEVEDEEDLTSLVVDA